MNDVMKIIGQLFALMLAGVILYYLFVVGGKNGSTVSLVQATTSGIANTEGALMGAHGAKA